MKCPCRLSKEYETKKIGNSVFITAEKQVYPDCYEGECPLYDSYLGTCKQIDKELEDK